MIHMDALTARSAKKLKFDEMLGNDAVMIAVNTAHAGVKLPPALMAAQVTTLKLSMKFRLETFEVTDEKIVASLSFGKVPFWCEIPFDSIFMMTEEHGEGSWLYPEYAPEGMRQELMDKIAGATEVQIQAPPPPPAPTGRPKLSVMNGGKS